jgi:putative PEP-CTERM system histidine kinase
MESESVLLSAWSFIIAAVSYSLLALYLFSVGTQRGADQRAKSMLAAIFLSAIWTAMLFIHSLSLRPLPLFLGSVAEQLRYGAWYIFLAQLLRPAEKSVKGVVSPLLLGTCLLSVSAGIAMHSLVAFRVWAVDSCFLYIVLQTLTLPILGLILVEQLFRNATFDSQWNVKPLCLALAAQFIFDLYLSSDALMFNRIDPDAVAIRGIIHVLTVPLLFIAALRNKDWTKKIRLSQQAAFHSATLLIAGLYLLFMSGVGYYVRYFGGEWGRALQLALVFTAIFSLGAVIVSGSMRAKLRVLIGKHFFNYRYDYREEWLRFTRTLSAQGSPQAMGQQVIRGLADMVESPAGALWLKLPSQDSYIQTARWNVPESNAQESPDSGFIQFLLKSNWVINLEEFRSFPSRYGSLEIPTWVTDIPSAWLIVPLMTGNDMNGFVIISGSRTKLDVNWEVNDLLRTAGCQAASFLARMHATEALLEARKFDAFNKMSAFVVHDLKNIITQLSLMLRNAERHRDNPEFQEDMLMTVENAVERMRQLMMQLREGAPPPGAACGVNLPDLIERIKNEKRHQGKAINVQIMERIATRGHEERLARVIGHLVQNAIDATRSQGEVWIRLEKCGDRAVVEIDDTGIGMSIEFINERLFKPFQTTKETGMGIGAYESAQYIRELGGAIEVTSKPGHGTRISVILPIFTVHTESDLKEKETA